MNAPVIAAPQHKTSKLAALIFEIFSSLRRSIVFARLCEAEWNMRGRIDAAALNRIRQLADID